MSLTKDLRQTITALDNQVVSSDEDYKAAFSTFTRVKLYKNETWRDRLVAWCEHEEKLENTNKGKGNV